MPEPAVEVGRRNGQGAVVGVLHVDDPAGSESDILDNIRNTGDVIDRLSYCPNDQRKSSSCRFETVARAVL